MKFEKTLSILSLMTSIVALILSLGIGRSNPLGSNLTEYNMTSPEASLTSLKKMVAKDDLRAGLQYLKKLIVIDDQDTQLNFFFDEVTDLMLAKTFVISGSGDPNQNGKVVSFVKYKVKGVEFRKVFFFKKLDDGTFYLTNDYSPPYYPEEKKTEAYKRFVAMIKNFRDAGAVN